MGLLKTCTIDGFIGHAATMSASMVSMVTNPYAAGG